MRTIHISLTAPPGFIPLGSEGEHKATQVQIDLSDFRRWYGEGYAVLQMCRPMDKAPFPVYTRMEGDILLWDVCSVHTARSKASGYGTCEISYFVGESLAKTTTIKTWVASSLGGSSPDTEPETPWKENVLTAAGRAETAAQTAQSAQNEAQTAATQAVNASTSSQASAQAASQSASAAASAKTSAEASASAAASAKTSAEASASAAQAVLDSIPPDYTKTTADVERLKGQKANIDGYYADMSVGLAENLISPDGVTDSEPYTHRTTAGGQNVTDGYASIRSLKGNSVVWNQLAPRDGRFRKTSYGVTYTDNMNGGIEVSGTAVGGTSYVSALLPVAAGHQYFLSSCPPGGSRDKYRAYCVVSAEQKIDYGDGTIFRATETANTSFAPLRVEEGATVNFVIKPYLVDLTLLFGAGSEPNDLSDHRITWLKEQLEKYPQYDAGTLLNVDVSGIRTVGFNQWDEKWELGSIRTDNGLDASSVLTIRSKNYIPMFANTEYCFRCSVSGLYIFWYDAAKKYISYSRASSTAAVQKPPENASYCRFRTVPDYGGIYLNDICINFSWSGYRNGEYEPYWSQTRALPPIKEILGPDGKLLFPDGLCRVGDVYDEITPTKMTKRVGYSEESGLYELENPIEVEFAEPYNFTYKISDFGTEEFISSARTAPVCHETLYMHNLRDDVRRLPGNYQSQTSMSNLLSALGQVLGRSIIAVWDEETKAYRYTVGENQQVTGGDLDGY